MNSERTDASRMPASSTTRPVSAGKLSASAGATSAPASTATAHSAARRPIRPCLTMVAMRAIDVAPNHDQPRRVLELHLRSLLRFLGNGEFLHRLVALVERRCPDHAGKRLQLGVVLPH